MFKYFIASKNILRQILKESFNKADLSLVLDDQTCDITTKHIPVYKI